MDNKQQTIKLTLGISPCPNDTFMFDALIHNKIDTEGLDFSVVMEDVETLNQKALKGELDISKVSFAAFTRITDRYQLLNSGSALGKGVGPLVVGSRESGGRSQQPVSVGSGSQQPEEEGGSGRRQSTGSREQPVLVGSGSQQPEEEGGSGRRQSTGSREQPVSVGSGSQQPAGSRKFIPSGWRIAIPGKNTTANFLFSVFFPGAVNKTEMIFSEIENAVLDGKADAGVIIHESRFTYEQKGLIKICDLGEMWEEETEQPVPLGGIAVRKNLSDAMKQRIDRVIKRSVEFAFANPGSSSDFVKENAQEMDEAVRRKHIETYVNDFSIDLGETGRNAIHVLFQKAKDGGLVDSIPSTIFVKQEGITV